MKVVTTYNNFARAKVDHDMMGRFDLPIYTTSADVFENNISNFKGNAIFRSGFENIVAFQDCSMVEFRFRNDQNYLLVFYATKIRFLSYDSNGNFGWVLNGGVPLEVTTPYNLNNSKALQYTQNADAMVFTNQNFAPYLLTRTSANSFNFVPYPFSGFNGSPFDSRNVSITGITQANPAVVSVAVGGHRMRDGDRVTINGVGGMTQVNGNTYTIGIINATQFRLEGVDSTGYGAYTSGGTASRASDYPKCCLYYKSRLYFADTPMRPTTVWGSGVGSYYNFDLATPATPLTPLQFTIADISQPIDWLFGGDNSLLAGSADGVVAINGGEVGSAITAETVEANLTSADGSNGSIPLRKDGLVFYMGRNNRNMFYFSYDLLSEKFIGEDANFISYDITATGIGKIRYKKDRNDLVFGVRGDGSMVSLNFKQKENIIGWHLHKTNGQIKDIGVIADNAGNPQLFALILRNGTYYIENQSPYVEFAPRTNFYSGPANQSADQEAYRRYVAEQLRQCNFLDNALKFSNLKTGNALIYNPGTGQITAGTSVFVPGDVGKHIVYKTITGYESGRYEITGYVSGTVVNVSVLQTPTTNSWSGDWYLSFSSLSGLSQFNGQTVGVVTDGGYLNDFVISGGTLDLGQQACSVVVGYRYRGVIKSFCLGFQAGAENTQATMKAICRAGLRTVSSAGGKFGTDMYHLEPVQQLEQGNLNYLPPPPIDGTKYIDYVDDNRFDKFFYIIQDEPLPLVVTCVMVDANYSATR